MKIYEYPVIIERDEDNRFVISCPALPGCFTEGKTFEEAMEMMKDAMQLYLRDLPEDKIPDANAVRIEKVAVTL